MHGIVKQAIQEAGRDEVPPPPLAEPEKVLLPPPAKPEEVPLPPPAEPEKVKPPPPEEVPPSPPVEVKPPAPKEVKPPRRKVELQTVAVVRAPALNADEATWLENLFHEAFVKLRKVVVHLGVPTPSHPLQMTVKDYAFKINVLVGDLERGVLAPVDDDRGDDGGLDVSGSGFGSDSNSDSGAPPAATTSA
jgi:hypothetical protein